MIKKLRCGMHVKVTKHGKDYVDVTLYEDSKCSLYEDSMWCSRDNVFMGPWKVSPKRIKEVLKELAKIKRRKRPEWANMKLSRTIKLFVVFASWWRGSVEYSIETLSDESFDITYEQDLLDVLRLIVRIGREACVNSART